ncbi:MAG TPA: hypothetical protein VM782_21960 [Stellaceae bacterium]|nr:hypothetical protein [Stellaceae bacterium]
MKKLLLYAEWAVAALGIALSPVILVFGVPFAYGLLSDVLDTTPGRRIVMAMAFAAVIVVLRRPLRRWVLAVDRWMPRQLTPQRNR